MRRSITRTTSVAASLALVLSACGGDDTGSPPPPTPAPSPGVTPTPTPTPTPTLYYPLPGIFGALGQTAPQAFNVLAIRARARSNGWEFDRDMSSVELGPIAGLRLEGADKLVLTIPGRGDAPLTVVPSGYMADGRISYGSFTAFFGTGHLSTPAVDPNSQAFYQASGTGGWISIPELGPDYPQEIFEFVYGIATPAAAVPLNGVARFRAQDSFVDDITIDFATGKVSGAINVANGLRKYVFADVVLGADRTSFKGTLTDAGSGTSGSIEGRLAGLNGEEMIAVYKVGHPTGPIALRLLARRI